MIKEILFCVRKVLVMVSMFYESYHKLLDYMK